MNLSTRQLGEEARGYPSATSSIDARLAVLAAGRAPEPDIGITVQKVMPIDENTSRVLLVAGGRVTASAIEFAVAKAFDGRVRLLHGSAHRAHDIDATLISAFVGLNKPTKLADTAGMRGMRVVTANVFADPETDTIWRKIGEGEDAVLVQDTEDDLTALLDQRRSHNVATASVDVSMSEAFSAGESVLWYDTAAETDRWGVAVSATQVFDPANQTAFASVDPRTVIIVRDRDDGMEAAKLPTKVTAAGSTISVPNTFPVIAPNNLPAQPGPVSPDAGMEKQQIQNLLTNRDPLSADNMIQRHLAYMSVLYSRNGEYFQRLQNLLKGTFAQKLQIQ